MRKKVQLKDAQQEKRLINFNFELKVNSEDDDYFYFEGYLSTYGNIDRGDDVMVKGCFTESLQELWPDLRWQHKRDEIIGVFTDIKSNDKGLYVKGKMPKADQLVSGRVIPQMKVGSVRAMSIGYWAQEYDYDENGIRVITKAMLVEGSLVSQPMNEQAAVTSMKAFDVSDIKGAGTKRELEALLRDSGAFSNKCAVYIASKVFDPSESDSLGDNSGALADELHKLTLTMNKFRGVL